MVDNLAKVENGSSPPRPPPPPNIMDTGGDPVSTSRPTFAFFCCFCPKILGPKYLKNPFLLRTLLLMIMQLFTLMALISQVIALYHDIQWNSVLEGQSLMSFPTPQAISTDRYVTFDDPTLKQMLHRNLTLPIIGTVLLASFFIFNILNQVYDIKNRYQGGLLFTALIYSLFAIALTLSAVGGICCTIKSSLSTYKNVTAYLLDMIPLNEDTLPYYLPDDNPISVKMYPQYFYQAMKSCEEGDTTTWQDTSELMGIRQIQIRIPSYHQLVQMGFCVSSKTMYVPVVILFCLAFLSATNVALCLMIRKMGILFMSSPQRTEEQTKFQEFEATLKATGRLVDADKIVVDFKMNE